MIVKNSIFWLFYELKFITLNFLNHQNQVFGMSHQNFLNENLYRKYAIQITSLKIEEKCRDIDVFL